MKEETFKAQKVFASEKKPSMLRRCVGHDYTDRQIYMITMVTEGRRPLFGQVAGRSDAPADSENAPHIELSVLGQRVAEEWWATSLHHPEMEVIALQMMPDHFHGILFVREKMEKPLGMALRGFKQSCNRHYRELVLGISPSSATTHQKDLQHDRHGEDRTHGMLFARGYNDKLLLHSGQLDRWLHYLKDNPRRLLMKREHPDLFRVQRNVRAAGITFATIGNRFLLDHPMKQQVQCSRRLSESEIKSAIGNYLKAARQGTVLVSPSISPGEKAIMRAAFDEGLPLIFLQENGFTDLAKPGGVRMEACARGQLLILAPWEHHNEQLTISRNQCLKLNDIAQRICENENHTNYK